MLKASCKVENIRALLARVKPASWGGIALLGLYTLFKLWLVADVELGKDEAAYWYWSQHLDASYALLPFGVFNLAHALLPGHEWFLRLGSILAGTASVALLYQLCRADGLTASLAAWATAAFATTHWIWHTSSYLHPDSFLVLCWLLALRWARQSMEQPGPAAHAKLGLAAGLAALCKYPGALLALGLFAWILATRKRTERWRLLLWALLPFLLVTAPLIHAQLSTSFYLPTTLGTLSQIAPARHLLTRLALFLLNPLFFVSPFLLWLLYRAGWRAARTWRAQLLALLPALFLLALFGFFALFQGQIKGNWILPAFLGLWPAAFRRPNLPSRPAWFLGLLLGTGLLFSLSAGLALKYPAIGPCLHTTLQHPVLNASYRLLLSPPDRQREASYSWTERACEYSGWQGLANALERTLEESEVSPTTPLLSPQYGVSFAMAYYTRTPRSCFTVDDPRFRYLADFHQQAGPPFPREVVFATRAGTPLPASLQALYPERRVLAELPRAGRGCAPIPYQVALLRR